jgi:hypothetical protein
MVFAVHDFWIIVKCASGVSYLKSAANGGERIGNYTAKLFRFALWAAKVFNTKVEIHVEKAESIPVNVSWSEASASCTALWRRHTDC